MVERMNPVLPISQQCRLLALPRSSVYRKPAGVSAEDLAIMALIDRHYLARPYYGSRGMAIERVNQVWCSDITYIPMAKGFLYLVVIMDWVSRAVLAWRLSNALDADFCVEALEEALSRYGRPEIFNT